MMPRLIAAQQLSNTGTTTWHYYATIWSI